MKITTFYSYKGGVGRTLACANYGLYLAKMGQKVFMADMDFEAPGLDSKFPDVDASKCQMGMMDQFFAFSMRHPLPPISSLEVPLAEGVTQAGGKLWLMPAGRYWTPEYYKDLASLQWDTFLSEPKGFAFCLDLIKRIASEFHPDILVIDSRTGLTELGGLCAQVFPDSVVLFTCSSPESVKGTRRVYERIRDSKIVKSRAHGRTSVDIRVVVSRIPRPKDMAAFDERMRSRVGLDVTRLYYLFDQQDMCLDEYLALDRFGEEHPAILDDYVELFASLQPEAAIPYVEKRLDSFRKGITRRSIEENRRQLEELIILFPHPSVFLEAARYLRQARGGEAQGIKNYLRYLESNPADQEALGEFAQECEKVPESELKPAGKIAVCLRAFGVGKMSAKLLTRYSNLSIDPEAWQEIVQAIATNDQKMHSQDYRLVYIRALSSLEYWQDIVASASEDEARDRSMGYIIAQAHARLGNKKDVINYLGTIDNKLPLEMLIKYVYLFFQVSPETHYSEAFKLFPSLNEPDILGALRKLQIPREMRNQPRFDEFLQWLLSLGKHVAISQPVRDHIRPLSHAE
ncbi:MAG: hypothetical protein NTX50_18065 [Candidatus Sumerlaeota bacterium]|nr:hypothetical protein [Candidatus Sumerlaeota bacterium]